MASSEAGPSDGRGEHHTAESPHTKYIEDIPYPTLPGLSMSSPTLGGKPATIESPHALGTEGVSDHSMSESDVPSPSLGGEPATIEPPHTLGIEGVSYHSASESDVPSPSLESSAREPPVLPIHKQVNGHPDPDKASQLISSNLPDNDRQKKGKAPASRTARKNSYQRPQYLPPEDDWPPAPAWTVDDKINTTPLMWPLDHDGWQKFLTLCSRMAKHKFTNDKLASEIASSGIWDVSHPKWEYKDCWKQWHPDKIESRIRKSKEAIEQWHINQSNNMTEGPKQSNDQASKEPLSESLVKEIMAKAHASWTTCSDELKTLPEVAAIYGSKTSEQFAPNGWGTKDERKEANSHEDSIDPGHHKLQMEFITERHKSQHKVVFPILLRIYEEIRPLLPELPLDPSKVDAFLARRGINDAKLYKKSLKQQQANLPTPNMELLESYEEFIRRYNQEGKLPPDLGQLPRLKMYEIWRDFRANKCTLAQATAKLESLWAVRQFPSGFTKLPPVLKGRYPTKEDMEKAYRKRTNCDPETGKPLATGEKPKSQNGKSSGARGRKPGTRVRFEAEKGESSKGRSTRPPADDSDEELPDAPLVVDSDEELPDAPALPSRTRKKSKGHSRRHQEMNDNHDSQYGNSSTSSAIILRSHPSSSDNLQPGYTASDERIVAYKILTRNLHGDDGILAKATTRRYVVNKGHDRYTLEWESECGGPKIYHLLPDDIPEINADLDDMPGQAVFTKDDYGIDWVACGPMPRGGVYPARLPDMACQFWWYDEEGEQNTRILYRSNMVQKAGKQWTDQECIRVLCPPHIRPKPKTLWDLFQRFYPHVEPLLAAERRRLLLGPSRATGRRAIENSRDSDVDASVNAGFQVLSLRSDSSGSDTDPMDRRADYRRGEPGRKKREKVYQSSGPETDAQAYHQEQRSRHPKYNRKHRTQEPRQGYDNKYLRHSPGSRSSKVRDRGSRHDADSEFEKRRAKQTRENSQRHQTKSKTRRVTNSESEERRPKHRHESRSARHVQQSRTSRPDARMVYDSESEEQSRKSRHKNQSSSHRDGNRSSRRDKSTDANTNSESEEQPRKSRHKNQSSSHRNGNGSSRRDKSTDADTNSESEEQPRKPRYKNQSSSHRNGNGSSRRGKSRDADINSESEASIQWRQS